MMTKDILAITLPVQVIRTACGATALGALTAAINRKVGRSRRLVGEEEKVFSRFTWHGTHRGEFFGVPATGKQITVKGMVVDRVVAGKMTKCRILMDGLSMMRQLGVIPE
jgi:SnoaL-like polyketide cyclase